MRSASLSFPSGPLTLIESVTFVGIFEPFSVQRFADDPRFVIDDIREEFLAGHSYVEPESLPLSRSVRMDVSRLGEPLDDPQIVEAVGGARRTDLCFARTYQFLDYQLRREPATQRTPDGQAYLLLLRAKGLVWPLLATLYQATCCLTWAIPGELRQPPLSIVAFD